MNRNMNVAIFFRENIGFSILLVVETMILILSIIYNVFRQR